MKIRKPRFKLQNLLDVGAGRFLKSSDLQFPHPKIGLIIPVSQNYWEE